MKILEIKKTRKNYSVLFDNNSTITLQQEIILSNNLKINDEIDEQTFDKITKENDLLNAENSALVLLARRQHSRRELFNKLIKKKYEKITVEKVLNRLEELGYINDKEFANLYTQEFLNKKHEGLNKIRARLYAKGVHKDIIDAEISCYSEDKNITENAFLIAKKKFNILSKRELTNDKIKQKLFSYLISKGYNYDEISDVLNKLHFKKLRDE